MEVRVSCAPLVVVASLVVAGSGCASSVQGGASESQTDSSIRSRFDAPYRGITEMAGRPVAWEYHFNANAIAGYGLIGGSSGVAVTDSGHLLSFVLEGGVRPRVTGRRILATPATTVEARGQDGSLLVATQDGRIWQVDPKNLELSPYMTVARDPMYLSRRADGAVIVVSRREPDPDLQSLAGTKLRHTTAVSVVSNGHTTVHAGAPGSAFMLDSQDRLWIGADAGEWGGYHRQLDTRTGRLSDEKGNTGVYGFAETPDGRILSFGGMIHMGSVSTFFDTIAPLERRQQPTVHGLPSNHRIVPITGVMMPAPTGPWFVTTHAQLFRTDPALKRLDYVGRLELRHFPGRPDSGGSYPAIRQLASLAPDKVLLATRRDGLAVLDLRDASISAHPLPNQLDAGRVVDVLDAARGVVAMTYDFGPYHWDGTRWTTLDPYAGHELDEGSWMDYHAMRAPNGDLVTVGADNSSSGTRLGLVWKSPTSPERHFLVDDSHISASGVFTVTSGELLGFESDFDAKKRYLVELGPTGPRRLTAGPSEPFLYAPEPIWSDETRTLLRAGSEPVLVEIVHDRRRWSFSIVHEPAIKEDLGVTDTLADGRRVLFATKRGVLSFDVDRRRFEPFAFPFEHPRVTSLERDTTGRLWLAADGLKLVHEGRAEPVAIPGVLSANAAIHRLTALTDGRLAVSLGERGLLLLRAVDRDRDPARSRGPRSP